MNPYIIPLILSLFTPQVERDTVYKPTLNVIRDTINVVINNTRYYYQLKEVQKQELLKPFEARFDGKTYILRCFKNENDTTKTK